MRSATKVGVYVDVSNMYFNGGRFMRYEFLREFACRDGAEPVRLNAYASLDVERAEKDHKYSTGSARFRTALRDLGYKVIVKEVKWYQDESGKRIGKANADLDLAIDALLQSDRLDRVLLPRTRCHGLRRKKGADPFLFVLPLLQVHTAQAA